MRLTMKQKMVIPLLASVIVSGLLGTSLVSRQLEGLKNHFVADIVQEKKGEIERAIERAGQEALEKAALFTKLPAVRKAFELAHTGNLDDESDAAGQQARELLRKELQPLLAGYSDQGGGKLKLHFHLPNGRSLARMWREKQSKRNGVWVDVSDDISSFRQTVLDVNRRGKPVKGIELGRGGFVIRGLAPVKAGGLQLGSVEVLVDFEPIFRRATEKGQTMLLYMNADKLPITKKLQDPAKYPLVEDKYVLVSGSDKGDVEHLVDTALLDHGREEVFIRPESSPSLAVFPVSDYAGQQVGVMALAQDTAALENGIHSVLLIMAGILLLILLLIMVVNFTALIKAVIQPVDGVVKSLQEGACQVDSAANQVSSAGDSLAEGAGEAAASIEETSASLEEIASMTRQNADHAQQADTFMQEVQSRVREANLSMEQLTRSMHEVSAGSEETFKIIKTIDDIAFQTNLLALNAAVEAARAGEAGAGFAVVADEVRNLARRAAEAAKSTEELIAGTVRQVKEGAGMVTATSESFLRVTESSGKASELVGEISSASQEQANGIAQINRAVTELDTVTQRNAAHAEESAAAARQLTAMADQMYDIVARLMALIGSKAGDTSGAANKDPETEMRRLT